MSSGYWDGYLSTEEAIKESIKIWKAYKTHLRRSKTFEKMEPESKLREYQSKYENFHKQFPIVFRYMIFYNKFYVKAFTRFMRKLEKNPVKSMEEKMERQAEYIAKYLYWADCKRKDSKDRYDSKYAGELYTDIYEALKKEKDDFERKHKDEQKEIARCIELNKVEKKAQLIQFLKQKLAERKNKRNT